MKISLLRTGRRASRARAAAMAVLALLLPPPAQGQEHRLEYAGAERQLGPVAYRDPLGVPSPDGRWLATHAGLHLYVAPLQGGPRRELGEGHRRRAVLVWRPDSTALIAREADRERTWWDWFEYDLATGERARLWPDREVLGPADGTVRVDRSALLELALGPGGRSAGVVRVDGATEVWSFDEAGAVTDRRGEPGAWSAPTWTPGGALLCLDGSSGTPLLTVSCGCSGGRAELGEVRGPLAVDRNGWLYAGRPNDGGTLDLWRLAIESGSDRGAANGWQRLTSFTRDTYAPYALDDGRVLFKLQEFAATIARVAPEGGPAIPVTTFQAETPSWDWSGERIAFTFGSWRRQVDDAHYPDISQHVGIVRVADGVADAPHQIVRSSYSEDQGMHWSPNGRWIALHSHADGSDDIWLQPADGSAAATPITTGGNETGWPRFSPDGNWLVYPTDVREGDGLRSGVLYRVAFDQETGRVTAPQQEVGLEGFDGQAIFAEFGPDSRTLFFEAIHGIGERAIWRVDVEGGQPQLVHRYASQQWFSAIGVSPDGGHVAFIAPAADGHLQLFRVAATGGEPVQLTFDATDKTHPSWSPRGDWIAFTAFRYLAQFWLLHPDR